MVAPLRKRSDHTEKIMKNLTKIIALVLALLIAVPAFASCDKKNEEPEIPDGPLAGGWTASDKAADTLTADEKAIFDKALEDLVGADHVAKTVLGTQVVAGTNYAFLCSSKPVVPNAVPYWCVATVYKDIAGEVKLLGFEDIDVSNVKTVANSAGQMTGAWSVAAKDVEFSISEAVDGALANHVGVSLVPVAVLGTQVVAGTNYRILAYGTLVTAEPVTDLYVVDVYASLDGKAEITSVNVYDLTQYVSYGAVEE